MGVCLIFLFSTHFTIAKENNGMAACLSLYQIAASAIDYKAKGKNKQEMLAPLPDKQQIENDDQTVPSTIIALNMYDIIDEIYDYDTLPIAVYAAYASEKCLRRVDGKPIKSYRKAHPQLQRCAMLTRSKAMLECAFAVANQVKLPSQ